MESGVYTKKYLCSQLVVALGGRVAEEIIYGADQVTTGASNDLQQVRNIARRMVAQWGFANENMGAAPIAWEGQNGNGMMNPRMASAKTEKMIDIEVSKLVEEAYAECKRLLTENLAFVEELTEALVEKETINYDELTTMRDRHLNAMALPAWITLATSTAWVVGQQAKSPP